MLMARDSRVNIKSAEEQALMRRAGRLTADVLDMIGPYVQAGVTTAELDRLCHDYIVGRQDAIPAPLDYKGFPKSICTSINHVVCHGIPGDRRLKPGDIGNAIQSFAEAHGYSIVREFCGHGIGRGFHEDPQVLHYGEPGTGLVLEAGMTFTIEPMVNAGRRHVKVLPDGWTVVTKDHSLSAQWEHTVLVTPDGVEVLTLGAADRAVAGATT